MPLGLGQVALGSVLLLGRFSPRWTQEPCLAPAGEITACKPPVLPASITFTGIGRCYADGWAQVPLFPSAYDPLEGSSPPTIGKPLYYLYFLKRRKPASKGKRCLYSLPSVPPWLAGTVCPAFLFEQPLVACVPVSPWHRPHQTCLPPSNQVTSPQ